MQGTPSPNKLSHPERKCLPQPSRETFQKVHIADTRHDRKINFYSRPAHYICHGVGAVIFRAGSLEDFMAFGKWANDHESLLQNLSDAVKARMTISAAVVLEYAFLSMQCPLKL